MQFIKPNTRYDFVGSQRTWVTVSVVAFVLAVGVIAARGFAWGIDFAGGTEVHVKIASEIDIGRVRDVVAAAGYTDVAVQTYGAADQHEFLVRVDQTSTVTAEQARDVEAKLRAAFGQDNLKAFAFNAESDKIDLKFNADVDAEALKKTLGEAGVENAEVKVLSRGSTTEFLVIPRGVANLIAKALADAVGGADKLETRAVNFVGPQVGESVRNDGIAAMIYALVAILIYVAFRFDLWFAPGAIVATAHDVVITLGVFALLGLEVSMTTVAAVLTIIGYSINDTIVVYDRIRENVAKYKTRKLEEIVNQSVNETLSRTILTGPTAGFAMIAILILCEGSVRIFAIAMLLGIVFGTYSSIFIASPLYIYLRKTFDKSPQARVRPSPAGAGADVT